MAVVEFTVSAIKVGVSPDGRIALLPPLDSVIPGDWLDSGADTAISQITIFEDGSLNLNIVGSAANLVPDAESNMTIRFTSGTNVYNTTGVGNDMTDPYNWTPSNSAAVTTFFNAVTDGASVTVRLEYTPAADETAPTLSSAATTTGGGIIQLVFDEALDTAHVPAPASFNVQVAGSRRNVASGGVRNAGSILFLTLESAVAYQETVTVAYTQPSAAATRLQDAAGNEVASFTAQSVTNNVPLPVPGPVRNLAESGVTQNSITWGWDAPNTGGAVTGYEARIAEGSAAFSGAWSTPTTSLGATYASLTPGTIYRLQVRARNASGPGAAVEDSATTSPPTLTATVVASDETPQLGAAVRFTCVVGGTATGTITYQWQSYDGTDWSDLSGETSRTYDHTRATAGAITVRCQATRQGVTAVSAGATATWGDTDPPVLVSANTTTAGIIVSLIFNEALDSGSIPAVSAFTFSPARTISSIQVAGVVVNITVTAPFAHDDDITLDYDAPDTNPLQDAAGNAVADFASPQDVTNRVPAPSVSSWVLTLPGAQYTKQGSDFARWDWTSGAPQFPTELTANGEARYLRRLLIDGENGRFVLHITTTDSGGQFGDPGADLSTTWENFTGIRVRIEAGDTHWDLPGTLTDTGEPYVFLPTGDDLTAMTTFLSGLAASGQEATATFWDGEGANPFAPPPTDTTPPTLSSAATDAAGTAVVLTFDEALDTGNVPAASAFTLSPVRTISNVAVSGATVTLTVSPAFANGDVITVDYDAPGTAPLQDASGNEVVDFASPQSVTNNVPAPAATTVTANAGADRTVASGGSVGIGGTDTVANGVGNTTIAWTLVSGGSGSSLSATNVASPTFTAPTIAAGGANRVFVWRKTVTNNGVSDTDDVTVTVTAPSATTTVVANAGVDRSVASGGTTVIGGADNIVNGVGATTVAWTRVSGSGGSLSSTTAASPTFTAPTLSSGASNRIITWRKTVTNNGVSDTDDVAITVTAPPTTGTSHLRLFPASADAPDAPAAGYTFERFEDAVSELRLYEVDLSPTEVEHNYHVRTRPLLGTFHTDEAQVLPGMGNGPPASGDAMRYMGAFVAFLNALLTQRGGPSDWADWVGIPGFTVWDAPNRQLYVSDGTRFNAVYAIGDLAAGVASLRTLITGTIDPNYAGDAAAAGSHGHGLNTLGFAVDPAADIGGLRRLGTSALRAAAGNHSH